MKFLKNALTSADFQLSLDEWQAIHQAFNEVCNGFQILDFEKTIGTPVQEVRSLMEEIGHKEELAEIQMSLNDLLITYHSLNAVCDAFGEWEFETRMGHQEKRLNI